ncbi:hypothetical protein THAOC_28594 [Thalassiosira oceanica]|uniref:HMG box domain-containing protein n=1 Tax=Thalassiosira oceanica TaxID=159749 RepID=K0RG18_THAOC|nr:hypothetical protein THAOC_28594 [Thalassiosira oceanica]|eukprot:EJK52170.1 hypothetical protein THAOC_28594 [Thalassiosira oceanica]
MHSSSSFGCVDSSACPCPPPASSKSSVGVTPQYPGFELASKNVLLDVLPRLALGLELVSTISKAEGAARVHGAGSTAPLGATCVTSTIAGVRRDGRPLCMSPMSSIVGGRDYATPFGGGTSPQSWAPFVSVNAATPPDIVEEESSRLLTFVGGQGTLLKIRGGECESRKGANATGAQGLGVDDKLRAWCAEKSQMPATMLRVRSSGSNDRPPVFSGGVAVARELAPQPYDTTAAMSSGDEDATKPPQLQPNRHTHLYPQLHQYAHHQYAHHQYAHPYPLPLSRPSGHAVFPEFHGTPHGMPQYQKRANQNHQPSSSDNAAVSPHDTHYSNVDVAASTIYHQSPYLSEAPSLEAGSGSTESSSSSTSHKSTSFIEDDSRPCGHVEVAKMWRNLSQNERSRWEGAARDDKKRFTREKKRQKPVARKVRAKKNPLAPKRPMSAFLMYAQRQRKIVQGDNPDLSNADVSRLLGEHWRNAKIEQKRPFLEREKAERKIYKAKTEAFKNNLKYFKANKKSQKSPEQLLAHGQVIEQSSPGIQEPGATANTYRYQYTNVTENFWAPPPEKVKNVKYSYPRPYEEI